MKSTRYFFVLMLTLVPTFVLGQSTTLNLWGHADLVAGVRGRTQTAVTITYDPSQALSPSDGSTSEPGVFQFAGAQNSIVITVGNKTYRPTPGAENLSIVVAPSGGNGETVRFTEVLYGEDLTTSLGSISVNFRLYSTSSLLDPTRIPIKAELLNDVIGNLSFNVNQGGNNQTIGTLSTFPPLAPTPKITSKLSIKGKLNKSLSYQITTSSVASSFSLKGSLPSGLVFDKTKGTVTGKPKKTGTFSTTIKAVTAGGNTAAASLIITISR